jgi:hypothetical protein
MGSRNLARKARHRGRYRAWELPINFVILLDVAVQQQLLLLLLLLFWSQATVKATANKCHFPDSPITQTELSKKMMVLRGATLRKFYKARRRRARHDRVNMKYQIWQKAFEKARTYMGYAGIARPNANCLYNLAMTYYHYAMFRHHHSLCSCSSHEDIPVVSSFLFQYDSDDDVEDVD